MTQTSGPGTATISPGTAFPLRAAFPVTGVYRLTVTASDGVSTLTEPLIIEVVPAASPPTTVTPALTLSNTWTMANVGGAATTGSQTFGATTASITGSGLGFEEVSDSLRFAWQPLTGDGSITARVTTFAADNGGNAFGGVMMRSTLKRESANVATTVRSAGNVRFSRRLESGLLHRDLHVGSGQASMGATHTRWDRVHQFLLTRWDDMDTARACRDNHRSTFDHVCRSCDGEHQQQRKLCGEF